MATITNKIVWADNTDALKASILSGTDSIVAMKAAVDKTVQSLGGGGLLAAANKVTAAVMEMGGANRLTSSEQERVNTLLEKAIEKYKVLGLQAPEAMRRLASETKPVPETLTLAQKATDFFSGSMLRLASSFAIGGLIERGASALISWGSAALESAGSMVDMSDKTGLSLRTIQQMEFVAKQTGTSLEAFSNAAFKLGTNLAGGSNSVVSAVDALGLSYRNLRSQSPDQQFNAVIAALENMQDPQERNRIAVELFGKAAREILPAIAGGYSSVAAAARIASDDQIRAIDRQQDAWERFKKNVGTGVVQALGGVALGIEKLTGAVHEVPKAVTPATESTVSYQYELERARTALGKLTDWQKAEIEAGQKVGKNTEELGEKFGVNATVIRLLTEETQKNTAEQKKAAAATAATQKAQTDAAEAVRKSLIPLTEAQKLVAISNEKLGISAETTAKQLGISAAAVSTFLDGIKNAKDVAEIWRKAHESMMDASTKFIRKNIADEEAAQQKIADARSRAITDQLAAHEEYQERTYQLTLHGTDLTIRQIERARDAEIAALSKQASVLGPFYDETRSKIDAFYQHQIDVANGTADTIVERMRSHGVATREDLRKTANDAKRDYEQMAARSGDFSEKAIRDQKRIADRAAAAANDTMTAWDRAYSALGDVGTILGNIPGKFAEIGAVAAKTGQAIMENLANGNVWGAVVAGATGAIQVFGKLWNSLFGTAGRDAVKDFASSFGGFDSLHEKLLTLGSAGEALWVKLTQGVGRNNPEQAKKVIEEINAALAGQDAWMQRIPGLIEKYGLSWADAGEKARQAHLDEIARGLIQDFADLSKAGFDVTVITEKMSGAINDYIQQAMATGTEVPAAMRPLLEKMIELGTLTDANGNKITDLEGSGITFATTLTEGFKSVVDAIKELTKALGGVPDAMDKIPNHKTVNIDWHSSRSGDWPDVPGGGGGDTGMEISSAATGGYVGKTRVIPFARGGAVGTDTVPAMLTPGEIVLNAAQQGRVAGSITGGTSARQLDRLHGEIEGLRRDLRAQASEAARDRMVLSQTLPKALKAAVQQVA